MRGMTKVTIWKTLLAIAPVLCVSAVNADDDLDELFHGAYDDEIEATANGTYGIAGTTATLSLDGEQEEDEPAEGTFRTTLVFQGLLIDFVGEVTCMAVDPANGRAWIGGVVVENNSDNPSFQRDIHQPGRDVWFRVLDTGENSSEADRTTFFGFEGAAGIITSEEYCQARIWPGPPDDVPNARTNALIDGSITVEPNNLDDDSDSDSD